MRGDYDGSDVSGRVEQRGPFRTYPGMFRASGPLRLTHNSDLIRQYLGSILSIIDTSFPRLLSVYHFCSQGCI